MDMKVDDKAVQDTLAIAGGGGLLAIGTWLVLTLKKFYNLPRKVRHLEETNPHILMNLGAQNKVLLRVANALPVLINDAQAQADIKSLQVTDDSLMAFIAGAKK